MYFVVRCLDKPGAAPIRAENIDRHRAYLAEHGKNVFVGGAIVTESDEANMIGSLMLVEADSLEQVRAFANNDPMNLAGVWESIEIHRFLKQIDKRGAT